MIWLKKLWFLKKAAAKPLPKPFYHSRIVQQQFESWTADDVGHLRTFLNTPTGKKLVAISGSETFQQSLRECSGDDGAPKAAGMDYLLRFQFNLASERCLKTISSASLDKDANDTDSPEQNAEAASELRSF